MRPPVSSTEFEMNVDFSVIIQKNINKQNEREVICLDKVVQET